MKQVIDYINEVKFGANKEASTYETVDLGLKSGTKWANKNIGAKKDTDDGWIFYWGTTDYFDMNKTNEFVESTKYNKEKSITINNDAAHKYMGNGWTVPTADQYKELIKYTTVDIDKENNLCILTSKINKHTLTFPINHFYNNACKRKEHNVTYGPVLWTATAASFNGYSEANTFCMDRYSASLIINTWNKTYGLPIRGVKA